ncbi:DUF2069 domain-containing protein [Ideonella sp. DXS29W]|uniref:DUF2069 domain-containing protein n=1 Tax=Ideonella lacteola TaxID=2984193 RepID=A0ABU9BTG2_9BURK
MSATPPSVAPASLAPDGPTLATRAAAIALWLALVILCIAWELWLAPTGRGTLAIKALPLLPALPGLLRMRMYTYRWLSLLVWLYATEGLVRVGSDNGRAQWLALAEIALSIGLFVACAAHVRWRQKRAAAETNPATPRGEPIPTAQHE